MNQLSTTELNDMARQIRRDVVKMLMISKSGHSGGPLGLADVFTALYFHLMNIDSKKPKMPERDYFFLSAGHLCPVWYATLAPPRISAVGGTLDPPENQRTPAGPSRAGAYARPAGNRSCIRRARPGSLYRPSAVRSASGSIRNGTLSMYFSATASSTRDRSGKR